MQIKEMLLGRENTEIQNIYRNLISTFSNEKCLEKGNYAPVEDEAGNLNPNFNESRWLDYGDPWPDGRDWIQIGLILQNLRS